MSWTLVNQWGIEGPATTDLGLDLRHPTYAAQANDGSLWIGDEYGTEKLVPFRFESRLIRVSPAGEIQFDSCALGIHDGFGCLLRDGSVAILCRTRWELLIVSDEHAITDRIPLDSMSKRMPRFVTETERATLLIVFCNRVGEVDLIEIDRGGRLLWVLSPGKSDLGIASSIEWLPADTFLIADPVRHVVTEIDRRGELVWQFGRPGQPSKSLSDLSSPACARLLSDGQRLISDTRNHRLLIVPQRGSPRQLQLPAGQFCDPAFATELRQWQFLVCDTGNRRIVRCDADGHQLGQWGHDPPQARLFSYPRSVEPTPSGTWIVADTANDRVVEIIDGVARDVASRLQPALFWPRCARPLPGGNLLIADGRHGRIVELNGTGNLVHELSELELDGGRLLEDPHDVRLLSNGHLLIADSAQDLVVETDWTGRVYRDFTEIGGIQLADPHSVQQLDDQWIVISDTGNHRIVMVEADGDAFRQLSVIQDGTTMHRLNFPRHAEISADGLLVIADTGNNRILASTTEGQLVWRLSQVPGTQLSRFNQPRWAKWIGPDTLLVCDHYHHRILRLVREP